MTFSKSCWKGEYWGAKFTQCDYEVEEEYPGEVFDIIKKLIEEEDYDYIPETLDVTAVKCLDQDCERYEERDFEINVRDYLSDEEYKELEELLESYLDEE